MIYTALGDSITFGENATSPAKAYPQLVVSSLNAANSRKASEFVLARPGWSSHELLDAILWRDSSMISLSDVVSVWIGGVDLAGTAISSLLTGKLQPDERLLSSYRANLSGILQQVRHLSRANLVCCTQYNPFPNSPAAGEWIGRLNRVTREVAARHGAKLAPAHKWFEGNQAEFIAGYKTGRLQDVLSGSLPIHPNDLGHRAIAAGLAPYIHPVPKPVKRHSVKRQSIKRHKR
ncbi:SGNH/GDSL hydrolase family protein [Paenibacillus macerans]|uniref:SGNH/GDSL hydrolase family protein n=1 Tax=Paenibacillus macerans TaxID=44252 RepID=UPI00203C56A8|nr:SGNH/GDSL hydrolase family protein [Paenibacillus macerans]MCM3703274.1 SGNH/GDSL hydrolase family protein [Paenibacillus macerans]